MDCLSVKGLICAHTPADKQGYLIFKEDGSSIDIAGSKIKDFKNSSATFNSFITVVTHWLKYVNPKTPAEARKRHDSAQWIEAENIEIFCRITSGDGGVLIDRSDFTKNMKELLISSEEGWSYF